MPEVISKRELVMRRLADLVRGVNPTNEDPAWAANDLPAQPYAFDLRKSVFTGKMIFGTEVAYPAVAILEASQMIPGLFAGEGGQKRKDELQLLVQGFSNADNTVEDPTSPAYQLMAAVETRLARINAMKGGVVHYPDDYLLGGLLTKFMINKGVVRPPEEKVSAKAYFYLPVIAHLSVEVANPYVVI